MLEIISCCKVEPLIRTAIIREPYLEYFVTSVCFIRVFKQLLCTSVVNYVSVNRNRLTGQLTDCLQNFR